MADVPESLKTALSGRYRIERELGSGGMAVVYLADDLKHHRPVAVKVLKPAIAGLVGAERFLAEIEIASRLTHPHILPLHDSGVANGLPYYVMPYAAGATLRERLTLEAQLPVADAVRIAADIARALQFAHDQEVTHRDIKPENILLEDGEAVVADFGIAKAVWALGGKKLTQTGVAVGTPPYMSPEQVLGEEADGRSDIYALGCVLYEMLAGQAPYTGPSAESIVYQHMHATPPDVRQVRPSVPPALAEVVTRTLAKTPADRFATASALRVALEGTVGVPAGTALPVDTQATTKTVERAPRPSLLRQLGVTGLLLVAVAAIAWWVWPKTPAQPALSPMKIAVFPFEVNAPGDLNHLREAMVTLLSVALNGAGELWTADHNGLLSVASSEGGGRPTPDEAEAVARRFGARLFVLGEVIEVGSDLRLQATIYRVGQSHDRIAELSAEGHPDSVVRLVDQLATRIIETLNPGASGRQVNVAASTTSSLEALKAFAKGEAEYRRGSTAQAVAALQRAVELDSTFSLAWYKLSHIGDIVGSPVSRNNSYKRVAADRAARWSHRLPELERQMVLAFRALRYGEATEAESLYRSILDRDPHHLGAWNQLGDLLSAINPTRGRSSREATEPLWHAAELNPQSRVPGELMDFEMLLGNRARVDSLAHVVFEAIRDPGTNLWYRAHYAFYRQDTTAQDSILEEMRTVGVSWAGTLGLNVVWVTGRLEGLERIGRVFGNRYASADIARGRWSAAREILEVRSDDVRTFAALAYFASAAFVPVTGKDLDRLRDLGRDTRTWESERTGVSAEGLSIVYHTYLLGLLSARLGDHAQARAHAVVLDSLHQHYRVDPERTAMARDLAASVRATVELAEGDPARALETLESAPMKTWWGGRSVIRFRLYERWLRAELLYALRRDAEALPWYETIHEVVSFGGIFLAPAHLRQAQIHERMGHADEAITHYRRFIDLWKDCDPDLRPQVDEARERLEHLVAATG